MFCKECGAAIESKAGKHKESGERHVVLYCANNCDGSKDYLEIIEQEGVPVERGVKNVVSLRDYTKPEDIKHVTHSRQEIEQIYECDICGPLQVINGVCIHIKPDEEHSF